MRPLSYADGIYGGIGQIGDLLFLDGGG